ncbi:hypothetical protein HF086_004234 [Spodoptera exigua]|uniref:Natalisin n=2 Tax=Spodoptera exigua TaxID=7107 RepID=A0A922MVZ2_SPOEX|nr:hypothetical protein HF086_004234 [Spodoptera exigua]
MRRKVQTFLLFILIITTDVVLGKANKTKTYKNYHKKLNSLKDKSESERVKRSLNDDDDRPFWPNRGKKQIIGNDPNNYNSKYDSDFGSNQKFAKSNDQVMKEQPFWGNRGRRDSSMENLYGYTVDFPDYFVKHCEHCTEFAQKPNDYYGNIKDRREDFVSPFWGNRGRRNSLESEGSEEDLFWGSRGRRQDQEPFWGNRGRRTENEPFWGNRGRREEEPFWGNRGRRDEIEPFWGNRGRREIDEPFWGNRGRRETDDPFWGNRGRREIEEPFWGNRGRREIDEPFWGNRGRREEEPFWGNRGRRKTSEPTWVRKQDLKESILNAINDVEEDIENLSRLKKSNADPNSFWTGRGRENKLSMLFNGPLRNSGNLPKAARLRGQSKEPGTVLDNRMYVDEPNYILVERTGRSSAEADDPYYISRGKKYYINYNLEQAARDRRGAIEEIVKSVRNDPYYIARGKKDLNPSKNGTTLHKEEYTKAKELICAAIDLIMIKNDKGKVKREIDDNDRDRRTILKKLAAQLQMDPYFVSRGKKNQISGDKDNLQDFISNVADKCN